MAGHSRPDSDPVGRIDLAVPMANPLTTSPAGRARIQGYEKCVLTAYQARIQGTLDVPTIGWGHTGADVYMGLVWTREQADAAFAADLSERFEPTVNRVCDGVPTTQGQFDAMVCLAYNIGAHGLAGSDVAKQHRLGNYSEAADAFEHWDHYHGRVNDALHARRVVEGQAYLDASPGSYGELDTDAPSAQPYMTPYGSDPIGHQKSVAVGAAGSLAVPLTWWLRVKHGMDMPVEAAMGLLGFISTLLVWLTPHGRK